MVREIEDLLIEVAIMIITIEEVVIITIDMVTIGIEMITDTKKEIKIIKKVKFRKSNKMQKMLIWKIMPSQMKKKECLRKDIIGMIITEARNIEGVEVEAIVIEVIVLGQDLVVPHILHPGVETRDLKAITRDTKNHRLCQNTTNLETKLKSRINK